MDIMDIFHMYIDDVSNGTIKNLFEDTDNAMPKPAADLANAAKSAMSAISKMREDLFDISYKPSFSKMYDDRGRLIGHIGYGFFIRKAIGYRIYRYHIYRSSDCFTFISNISKMLNRKGKLFFDIDSLKFNLGTGLKVFEKFEDAKKFCILKYLENTNHNDF